MVTKVEGYARREPPIRPETMGALGSDQESRRGRKERTTGAGEGFAGMFSPSSSHVLQIHRRGRGFYTRIVSFAIEPSLRCIAH